MSRTLAVALALVSLSITGCSEITGDLRLQACGADLPGNRVHSTVEVLASDLVTRWGIDPTEHPELLSDRPVFVVIFIGPVVVRERHGENVINRMHHGGTVCAWFSEREVHVYDHVPLGEDGLPGGAAP